MKLILTNFILFSLFFSNLAIAQTGLNKTVPGKDYTYRQLLLQRAYTKKLMQFNKDELNGVGIESNSILKIKKEKNKEGKEEKKYYLYRRGCGDIEIKEEDKEKLEKLKDGMRIKFKLKGTRSCEISEWKVF